MRDDTSGQDRVGDIDAVMPAPTVATVSDADPSVAGPVFSKKDLLDAVTEMVDVKRPDVKKVLEAALQLMGEKLGEGRELNLSPMGRIMPKRTKSGGKATVVTCKVRVPQNVEKGGRKGLAEGGEDD